MLFLGYRNDLTCVHVRDWLTRERYPFQWRDIQAEPASVQEIRAWWKQSGLPLQKLLNISGLKALELGLRERLDSIEDEELLELMSQHFELIKRPILVGDDFALVGFSESEWKSKFKAILCQIDDEGW